MSWKDETLQFWSCAVTLSRCWVESKPDELFKHYNTVYAMCYTTEQQLSINSVCHKACITLYPTDVFGYYGYMFADLGNHKYAEEVCVTGCNRLINVHEELGTHPEYF